MHSFPNINPMKCNGSPMLMDCPICGKEFPVETAEKEDTPKALVCLHCRSPLTLDRFAGRLSSAVKKETSQSAPMPPSGKGTRSSVAYFQPRLSTGRDNLAALFVIICIVAIVVGGISLATGFRSSKLALPTLNLEAVVETIENLLAPFLGEQSRTTGGGGRDHLRRGKTMVQQKAYAKGLIELDKAIKSQPDNYEAHFWRGRALLKSGRDKEAIAAFETTLELNPRYSYALDNLAWIYLRRNDFDTSLGYLNQSLEIREENAWALFNRGRIHFQKGREDKALADTEAACRLGFNKACQVLKRYRRESQA